MNEEMKFPETFEQFIKEYGFKDNEEVYTNGSDLIQIFRVKQWLEHQMTVEEYRQRMIQAFHNADCDELIALVCLPTEKEFEHLEWLLKTFYKQKHGEWISEKVDGEDWKGCKRQYYQPISCSKCHSPNHYKSAYCPNCGAKMFEQQESEEV